MRRRRRRNRGFEFDTGSEFIFDGDTGKEGSPESDLTQTKIIEALSVKIKPSEIFQFIRGKVNPPVIEYLEYSATENEKGVLETRRQFCLNNIERSFKIAFKNKEVGLYTSMFQKMQTNTKNIPKDTEIDPEAVIDMVYGVGGHYGSSMKVRLSDLTLLFDFFQSLNIRSCNVWEFNIVKLIQPSNFSLKLLVLLFKKTYERYEKPILPQSLEDISLLGEENEEGEEIKFKSTITTALFNILSKNIQEISKNRSWARLFETVGVWGDLVNWKQKPLEKDERYAHIETYDFPTTRKKHFEMLFDNLKDFHNFIIVSADEKETPVHKEIIVLYSDYFYQVINFGGTETRREGYLILENLKHEEVNLLIEYIYKISFDFGEKELMAGLNLLKEIIMYPNEKKCQVKLMHRIVNHTESQIERGTFFSLSLPSIGFMFHLDHLTFPKEVTEGFIELWIALSKKSKDFICQIIYQSFQKHKEILERESMEERIVGKFKDVDNRIDKIENNVGEMKSSLKDVIERLKSVEEFIGWKKRKNEGGDEEARKKKIRKRDGDKDVSCWS